MILGVQVVSISLLLSIIILFVFEKKLPILSTKWYVRFLIAAVLNAGFEVFSLYTLYNMENISPTLNRVAHQLFMISLIGVMHCLLWFIDIRGRNLRRYTPREFLARMSPFFFVAPVILFGDVKYHIEGTIRYSYGPMAYGTIVIAGLFILSYFLLVFHFRKKFTTREKRALLSSLMITVVVACVQARFPHMLLSSMAVALMAMNIFVCFENPREYADHEVAHTMNINAFMIILNEYIQSKKAFYVVSMTLTNSSLLKEAKGYGEAIKYVDDAAEYLFQYAPKQLMFHPKRDWVSIIFTDKKKYEAFMEIQTELFSQPGHEIHDSAKYVLSILECPKYASSADEVVAVLDYLDKDKGNITDKILYVDESILDVKRYKSQVETLIQAAIETDGFEVYYQPIFSNETKRFSSAEALVRLLDTQTLGYISPEEFIPIAEENGLIGQVGDIVFQKVCEFISKNNLTELGIDYIEVNLSGAQFMDEQLNGILSSYVKRYNVPPEFINLEITETASIEAGNMLEYNMKRLKESHFKFSMDDFGTGYSNLAKMAQAEFDLIKLDKTLIWPCFEENTSKESRVILDSCIDMIHKLGKAIVAEGVETKEQVDYLTERGVKYLQGFYFTKPVCGEKYITFIKKHE